MMKEGFIYVDKAAKIKLYNKRAKEIFRIDKSMGTGHPQGAIKKGDLVIIGDNCLGKDDGGLKPESLSKIGIFDKTIRPTDVLMAVGTFEDGSIKPVYRHYHQGEDFLPSVSLQTEILGFPVSVQIGSDSITISFGGESFVMSYINSIGHLVIIDRSTFKVKFYQTDGYTARSEDLLYVLNGKHYRAKGPTVDALDIINQDISSIHKEGAAIQELCNVARGGSSTYKDQFSEINGIPTLCSVFPVDIRGKRDGAVLKIEDISSLQKVIQQRNDALTYIEEMKELVHDKVLDEEGMTIIKGESPAMKNVKKLACKASRSNSTVLLLGESGTGKSHLAETIHGSSTKKDQPFIHVNCGAMPESLLESELFGYEKGSFTGANSEGKAGLFEKARGGTIFLDEIGDISLAAQVKLLGVLQNKTFFKLGGTTSITADVRIIAATNKNLEEEIKNERFREDLFYRLNVFPIWMPPLRERKEDICCLCDEILSQICEKLQCGEKFVSPGAQRLLIGYHWPGNVRELENTLERAANMADGRIITEHHLPERITSHQGKIRQTVWKSFQEYTEEAEKRAILETLAYYNNDKKRAMQALKMGKTNFYQKIKKYNL
ncbi:AAA family ATPase [Aminipila butyrica]|uniref:AAA family ATPase n=2 Tax=Aminipila butyrica TaxID=433296 RepID=A0A858BX31_9FIRM|nr:AAA family ATPase [Aminipila butyrica]